MVELYNMMFKRKSFRQFKRNESISAEELQKIESFLEIRAQRISEEVNIKYKIIPTAETSCKRGEYCILIYGNHDNKSLLEIGYMFGQLDFFLSSINLGSCWYGMGKPHDSSQLENLPYVIMIAIGKAYTEEFRKNYKNARRKLNDEISEGDINQSFLEYIKYSPSACNSQPWLICRNEDGFSIKIKYKEKILIPKDKISFYNTIDLGILMFSCEMWLKKNAVEYKRIMKEKLEPYHDEEIVVSYELKQIGVIEKTDF